MKKLLLSAVFVGILIFVITGGIAHIMASDDVQIRACVKKNGTIYIISDAGSDQACKANDTLLSWNITGAQGSKGDSGDQGPIGPKGDVGDLGPAGPQGAKGEKGDTGPQGLNGQSSLSTSYKLVDVDHKVIGDLITIDGQGEPITKYIVAYPEISAFLKIQQNVIYSLPNSGIPATFVITFPNNGTVYYEDQNCSADNNPAFWGRGPIDQIVIGAENQAFIVNPLGNDVATRLLRSYYDGSCHNVNTNEHVVELKKIQLPFTLPINGPLKFEKN